MATKTVTIPKSSPDSSFVQVLPLGEEKTVAVYGGLGSLPERFLAGGFSEVQHLFPEISFVAIDKATDREQIAARMGKIGLPWHPKLPYASVNDINLNSGPSFSVKDYTLPVDGVITAVPTSAHLAIAEHWAPRRAWVWVDKPITMIHEISAIRRLAEKYGNVFAVDFFLDSDAMAWFLANMAELLGGIGKITALHGRLIESWPVKRELGQRVWLLTPEISGGGLGIDQAVHQLAMLSPVVETLGLKLGDVKITDVVMGGNDPSRVVETAFWCRGRIGDVSLLCDCGKGVDDTYYGATVIGENGSVEICAGTEEVDPYVRIVDPTGTTVYHFDNGQIGYGRTWFDYLTLIYGGRPSGLSLKQRLDACTGAVEVVGKAYVWHSSFVDRLIYHEVGQPLPVPEAVLGQVAPEIPRSKQRTWAQ